MKPSTAMQGVTRQEMAALITIQAMDELKLKADAIMREANDLRGFVKRIVIEAYDAERNRVRPKVEKAKKPVRTLQRLSGNLCDGILVSGLGPLPIRDYDWFGVYINPEHDSTTLSSKFVELIRALRDGSTMEPCTFCVNVDSGTSNTGCNVQVELTFDFDPHPITEKLRPFFVALKDARQKMSEIQNAMEKPDVMERRALARLTQQALELDGQLEPSVFPIEPIKLLAK
jgi:hypothetical protein